MGLFLSPYVGGFYLLGLFLFLLIKDKKLAFVLLLSFLAGLFYYQLRAPDFELPLYEGEEVQLKGVSRGMDRNIVEVEEVNGKSVNEKVVVRTDGDLSYGQVVKLKGRPVSVDDEFKNYYYADGISSMFFDPEVEVIGQKKNLKYYILQLRETLSRKIEKGLVFPHSSVLKALLLGDRSSIPDELSDKFSKAGVAHLLAISGTHIVIIAGILISLASLLSIKWKATFALGSLFIFIILVGAPASAVRAGLMGAVLVLANKVNRAPNSLRSLFYVGLVMLAYNPLLLWTASFQLSFGATTGIVLFSSRVNRFLTYRSKPWEGGIWTKVKSKIGSAFRKVPFISDTLSITLSAQVFTLPLVYFYFDYLPLLAPFSNLVLTPLLPVIMVLGLVCLLLFLILPSFWLFLPVQIVLSFVLIFVNFFYKLYLLW